MKNLIVIFFLIILLVGCYPKRFDTKTVPLYSATKKMDIRINMTMNKNEVISNIGPPEKVIRNKHAEIWWYNTHFPSIAILLNPIYWISGMFGSDGYREREEIYWEDDHIEDLKVVKYYLYFY
jgi:hypothetical protein